MNQSPEITLMLQEWSDGDQSVVKELVPLVYDELYQQATMFLHRERPNHTLQTTALINEVYLKLIGQNNPKFNNRLHFFAFVAHLMRRILVDYARMKSRKKRGGDIPLLTFDEITTKTPDNDAVDLIELDQALRRLEKLDKRQARIVELRYFSGMTLIETAEALKISRSLVAQEWALAKAWLYRELTR
jgi:RNA polymerase sigma factor (TIGR02999 family)